MATVEKKTSREGSLHIHAVRTGVSEDSIMMNVGSQVACQGFST